MIAILYMHLSLIHAPLIHVGGRLGDLSLIHAPLSCTCMFSPPKRPEAIRSVFFFSFPYSDLFFAQLFVSSVSNCVFGVWSQKVRISGVANPAAIRLANCELFG